MTEGWGGDSGLPTVTNEASASAPDETMTDIDKLAREIAGQFCEPTELEVKIAVAAMKLQRERDAVIAESYPSPMNDLPMALAMRSVAAAIRSAL